MKRRSFLAGISSLPLLTQAQAQPAIPARKLDRLALSSSSYRANYDGRFSDPAAMPRLSHVTLPRFVRDTFGMRRIELWDQQFGPEGHTTEQCKLVRAAADAAGVSIISVEVEDLPNLGQADKVARAAALGELKAWLDKGKILGTQAIRVNLSRRNDPVDKDAAIDTLHQGADYARSIGLHLMLENHGGFTASIPDMIAMIKAVNSDYLRIEVDWGAWTPEAGGTDRYAAIQSAMPYVFIVSAKGEAFDEATYDHTSFDIAKLVKNAEAGGYRGLYSIELYTTPAPKDTARAVRSMMRTITDNMV